jgi:nucleoside-diphosphate-sugar epimerase
VKALFIGGTGLISQACTALAAERGIELYVLNRGRRDRPLPPGVRSIEADIKDADATARALAGHAFDVVANFIAFNADDIERDLRLFKGRCAQYIFVSSASAYQKPVRNYLITENTPLENPFWKYSQDKIAAEQRLMRAHAEEGFPATIVRPSLTIGDGMLPHVLWYWNTPWTVAHRILAGKPLIVPGDGTSLWVVTHNTDFAKGFVGLMGNRRAIGEAFHITTDEVANWDIIYQTLGDSLGKPVDLIHIASEWLIGFDPPLRGTLLGDKAVSVAFDNSKIKSVVPDFRATVSLRETCDRCVAWFRADVSRQRIDAAIDARTDDAIARYRG